MRATKRGDKKKVAQIETDLALPEFPKALTYLWRLYHRIRRRKSMGFSGPNPIEWPDIQAFARLTDTCLAPWEVEILEGLDDAYLTPTPKQTPAPSPPPGKDIVTTADISDTRGVRALLRSIAGRGKRKKGG